MDEHDTPASRWVTAPEVAAYFEVTRATIYTWIKQGRINALRLGNVVRIPREEFEYIKAHGLRRPTPPSSTSDDEPSAARPVAQPVGMQKAELVAA